MTVRWVLLPLVLACGSDDPADTAPSVDEGCGAGAPRLQFAHGDSGYGEPADGDPVLYGWPPQGGAPYSPFDVRYAGLTTDEVTIAFLAIGADDGATLGEASYTQRFVCSNTGESEGWYVTSELHMRFFGYELDELEGRAVDVTVSLDDGVDTHLEAGFSGVLTPLP